MMLEGERERGGEEDKSFVKRIKPQTVRWIQSDITLCWILLNVQYINIMFKIQFLFHRRHTASPL